MPLDPVLAEDGASPAEGAVPLFPESGVPAEELGDVVDELLAGAVDPPPLLEELGAVLCWDGFPPVAVGGASEY